MYTGTLIEDLIAAVDRVKAQAGDVVMHEVRAEARVEGHDTEVVPVGSHNADSDLIGSAHGTATALSSDFISPHGTLDDTVCLVAAEDSRLTNAHMWAVTSGATRRFGHHDRLA